MEAAPCHFYGHVFKGAHPLTGKRSNPATWVKLVAEGKVTNFKNPRVALLLEPLLDKNHLIAP